MKMAKMPRFKSDKEIRGFWDTHSLADFGEDLKPASIAFKKTQKEVVSIRLERPRILALKHLAHRLGIGYSSLARIWVMEKLNQETRRLKAA